MVLGAWQVRCPEGQVVTSLLHQAQQILPMGRRDRCDRQNSLLSCKPGFPQSKCILPWTF